MKLASFAPPGNVTDFDPSQRQAWSEFMNDSLDEAKLGVAQLDNSGPRGQFYNPLTTDTDSDVASKEISWRSPVP